MQRSISLIVITLAAILTTGCTGVELAVVASAAKLGAQGAEVSRSGKINLALMASTEEVRDAALAAADDLGLEVIEVKEAKEDHWSLRFRDESRVYKMSLDRRTPRLTRVKIKVGWFGPTSIGQLFVKRLAVHLDGAEVSP